MTLRTSGRVGAAPHWHTRSRPTFTSVRVQPPSNFSHALERADSELAQQITKVPFTLEFLAIDGDAAERQVEARLVERSTDTLRELGSGFAFVGRQVHFDVDGDDFFVDLMFFHVDQFRYVVIELKTTKFEPRDAGQLGF